MDEKILIYTNKNASKAKLLYDLSECEARGNYINEIIFNQNNLINNTNKTNITNNTEGKPLRKDFSTNSILRMSSRFLQEEKENIFISDYFKIQETNLIKNKINSTSNVLGITDSNFSRFSYNKFDKNNENCLLFTKRLNYEIEINHPFLEKCVIRGSNVLEAFDFYKKIQQITSEYE